MRTKTNNIMKKANVLKNNLQFYISHNEVVYQVNDELMEVANEKEEMNRITLLNYLNATSTIEVFCKCSILSSNKRCSYMRNKKRSIGK